MNQGQDPGPSPGFLPTDPPQKTQSVTSVTESPGLFWQGESAAEELDDHEEDLRNFGYRVRADHGHGGSDRYYLHRPGFCLRTG